MTPFEIALPTVAIVLGLAGLGWAKLVNKRYRAAKQRRLEAENRAISDAHRRKADPVEGRAAVAFSRVANYPVSVLSPKFSGFPVGFGGKAHEVDVGEFNTPRH